MFRRFKKSFSYKNDAGQKITIPRQWAGELPDDVAAKADAEGATLLEKVKAAQQDAAEDKSIDDMTKEELLAEAAKRNVQVKPADNKAEILAALKAAEQPAT